MPNSGNIATISGNLLTDSGIDLSTKADLVAGLIPSSQLPSYVDDILEYANLAAFPATGETGKIYVALDTNETYRWSGSAYVRIANGAVQSVNTLTGNVTLTTANIAESGNLYYTDARVRAAISASGSLSYNASTGVFSYTTPNSDSISEGSTNLYFTNARARAAISVSGSLSYNSITGVISYTQPTNVSTFTNDAAYITTAGARNAISVSGSLSYNASTGVISYTQPTNISAFTNDSAYVTAAGARSALSFTAGSGAYNSSTGVITIPTNTNQLTNGAGFITGYTETDTLSSVVSRGSSTSTGITINPNGTSITMGGGASAEGIRMQASTSTTYPVFLRSVNPSGGGETSAWIFKEAATEWGIWHNNPINTLDITRAPGTGIENNVGGGTNTVMIRLSHSDGSGQFTGNILNRVGSTILDQNGNIPGTAASETLSTVTGRGSSTSTAITINSNVDQLMTLNATDSSWVYIGLSWNGTRRSYIGLNSSGEPEWGTDTGNAFRFVGSSTMTVGGNTVWHSGNFTPGNYLPLSGGTMSGSINMSGTQIILSSGFSGIEYHNTSGQWEGFVGTELGTGHLRYNSRLGNHTWYSNSSQAMKLNSGGTLDIYRIRAGGSTHDYEASEGVIRMQNNQANHNYIVSNGAGWSSWNQWIRYVAGVNTWRIGTYDDANNSGTSVWRLAGVNRGGAGEINYIVAGPRGGWGSNDRVVLWNPYARYDNGDWQGNGTNYKILDAFNYSSYALPLSGGTITGPLRFNEAGYGRIAFTDNYHGMILRGIPTDAGGSITATDVTSLIQYSGDFRFYRTNGSINELYFQVNATAAYWRGNTIWHGGNLTNLSQLTNGPGYITNNMSGMRTFGLGSLGASGAQARRYEIARLGIDYNDWNSVGTFEVELHENYFAQGLKKVYNIWYGYVSNSGVRLVEQRGTGANNFRVVIGNEVVVSGDHRYLPVYVDVSYYGACHVMIRTNRSITDNSNSVVGGTYIFTSPSGTNISDFSLNETVEFTTHGSASVPGNFQTTSGSSYLRVSGITNGSYIELSGNLPGHTNAAYPVIKSGGTIHFANNNKYAAYLEGANTYFGLLNNSQATKVFFHTSGNSYFTGGSVGIGTDTPGALLDVRGKVNVVQGGRTLSLGDGNYANHILCDSNVDFAFNYNNGSTGGFGFFGGTSSAKFMCSNTGTLTVSGDVVAYGTPSDARLKDIKEKVPNALSSILKLSGYRFDWKEREHNVYGDDKQILHLKEDIGVIAQEVAEVLPELARTNEDGFMSVRYQGLTAVLIEAIKEQQSQIEAQKTEIEELKDLVKQLLNK